MKIFPAVCLFLLNISLYSEDALNLAKEVFQENNYEEASFYFEQAISEDPANREAYLYLGETYAILKKWDDAERVFKAGEVFNDRLFTLKRANVLYSAERLEEAEEVYSSIIAGEGSYVPEAYLNRANVRVTLAKYLDASSDYTRYLELDPETDQKADILKMIYLCKKEERDRQEKIKKAEEEAEKKRKAEEERKAEEARLAEEEKIRAAEEAERLAREEEQRLAREREKQREEEERQRALMDDILNSLNEAGKSTQGLQAGSEEIDSGFEESDIDE